MDFGWEVCSLLLHRELPPSARHGKFETDWEGKKKKTSKTSLDKHTEAPKEGVCTQRVRNQSPVAVLIEAGLGCSLRAIGTLKELFLFASSDGPKQ